MALGTYPPRYITFNTQQSKRIAVVVQIPGVDSLSNTPIFTRIRYGDEGLLYGQPGIVYGGLRRIEGNRDYLSLEGSSLTIGQKVEPEQGRAAVSVMTLAFIDKDGYMSQVISPGVVLDEILGKPVRIYLGYADTSFPEDYFTVFRGFISGTQSGPGLVTLQLSDSNFKSRQQVFTTAKSTLTGSIGSGTTTIPITATGDFHQHVLGPDGSYDTATVKTYIRVEDEWMEYGPGAVSPGSIVVSSRGARGTSAVAHGSGAEVAAAVELTGVGLTLALKVLLSGWAGPYITGQAVKSFKSTGTPTLGDQNNAFVLPFDVDAVEDLGLAVGDWFTSSGSGAGNNFTGQVTNIGPWEDLPNRVVYTDQIFNSEPTTSAVISLRSQYDTLPVSCGLKLDPTIVDVATFARARNFFLSQDIFQFFIQAAQKGKSWLESEIFLVEGAYPVTRYGRMSVNLTRPPLADQKLTFLDKDAVLNPDQIVVMRATNSRRFFNEIRYDYDQSDAGEFLSQLRLLDTESLSLVGVSSVLPVQSAGLKTTQSGALIAQRRGRFLLTRYKNAAFEIAVKTNWEHGSVIEAGEVVALVDEGNLKITNLANGERDIGTQLFEVIDRQFNIRDGNVSLRLLSNVGFDVTDRYAVITPSSLVDTGSSTTRVNIQDSFGDLFLGDEQRKWTDYVGLPVCVHDYYWTYEAESILQGFDSANDHQMILDPPLPFAPAAGDIVDFGQYPTSTDPKLYEKAKVIHCYMDPTLTVVTGISPTQFTVSPADAAKIQLNLPVLIHNADYSILSDESKVLSVVGVTVTLQTALAFTPAAGQYVELVGFPDGRGAYRVV